MTDKPAVASSSPVAVIVERLTACNWQFERKDQTACAIIGALEQSGWVIVRKRHMRDPK